MIRRADFRFRSYQAAFFYANLQFATNRVLPQLLSVLGTDFDGDPIVLPVPEGAPPEVARIILQSKDGALRMELSLARVDVRRRVSLDDGAVTPLTDFIELARRSIAAFNVTTAATAGRVALVLTRVQFHESPAFAIAKHFCRPELLSNEPENKGPLNRPEAIEIHALKKFKMGPLLVNSWVRCKTATFTGDREKRPLILVEQDINTPPERLEEAQFGEQEISEFFDLAATEVETIMRLYFPDNG